jgi:hypothetical protein
VTQRISGFVCDIVRPTRDADRYVACVVVTPYRKGKADLKAKAKRNIGKAKAVQLAAKLLERCDASAALIKRVKALNQIR